MVYKTAEKTRQQKGFTLLEVLLAVGLMLVVVTVVYNTLSIADKAYEGYRQYAVRLQQMRTVMAVLRREVLSAFYNNKDPFCVFSVKTKDHYGKEISELYFTTIEGQRPPLRIRYYVKEDGDRGLSLFKEVTTVSGNKMHVLVLEGLQYFSIKAIVNDKPLDIFDVERATGLPDSLRIRLAFFYNEEIMDMSMSVRPRSEVIKW